MINFSYLAETYPFFSLIFSLILFLGLYGIGQLIFFNKQMQLIFLNISELKYQHILIAVNFLMFILFPIVLFFPYSKEVLNFFSIIIFLFGVCKFYLIAKKKIHIEIKKLNFEISIFCLLIAGYFLITFSPINHADSLDYHMSGAIHIFKTGKLPTSLENFHNLLVGSGEVFYSLGFFFGAEQFGTLVQFSGLLSLIGVLEKFKNKNKIFFILLILSSPVKFSFILSSFILYALLFIYAHKKNFLLQSMSASFILIFFFYLCFPYWKSIIWGSNFHHYLTSPFPEHLEGVKFFKSYLMNYNRETSLIYLFLPKSPGQFTDALGLGFLIFFYFFFRKETIFIYFSIIFLFFYSYKLFFWPALFEVFS